MRILGIDPGLRITGFGIIEAEGSKLHYIASGTIKTDAVAIGELPARLKIIFDGVREVTTRYEPTCAAVEIVFVNVNPQSTLLLGQARGAAITGLVTGGLDVSEYTALQMKKAIVGHGHARKEQVQEMVMRLLQLPGLP
ncbi:MAG: crossover junction endodeoxyribonuclease RuvC, partial [Burkholderiaceae bacterium]|nr:crossover junction endodeoxyribonuclease RuvC [Burkholderiaceae bacterium]